MRQVRPPRHRPAAAKVVKAYTPIEEWGVSMLEDLADHFRSVVRAIRKGRLVPFLGAGVNLTDRTPEASFKPGGGSLPSGYELARYLTEEFEYPAALSADLSRVSQYASVMEGDRDLYLALHEVFADNYLPTSLHRLLASIPRLVRAQKRTSYQLIVTTNYDDGLERAFAEAGEEYDLLTYAAVGPNGGKFLHRRPSGEESVVDSPNDYPPPDQQELSLEKRTVIAKIHGTVDRQNPENDSYVVTEDHYIDYPVPEQGTLLPHSLSARLADSHLLFLGYSLTDWNLRVILHRLWRTQKLEGTHWAVQLNPEKIDQKSWGKRGVEILDIALHDYVKALEGHLTKAGATQ
jgi:SIR2-like domain